MRVNWHVLLCEVGVLVQSLEPIGQDLRVILRITPQVPAPRVPKRGFIKREPGKQISDCHEWLQLAEAAECFSQ
eukprot:5772-Eustigmatos_ZCMA.PRE.1